MTLLKAMWQADGTFPSGGFAFSNGLEGAAALAGPLAAEGVSGFVEAALRRRWASADRVALVRAFRADGDLGALAAVDRDVEATTLVEATRAGSRRNGAAFLTTHARLGCAVASDLRAAVRSGTCLSHLAVMQGAVWRAIGLDEPEAILASGYGAASTILTAAVRLGAVGAIEAQTILAAQLPLIERLARTSLPEDGMPSSLLPWHELAAARHVRADVRLFSN